MKNEISFRVRHEMVFRSRWDAERWALRVAATELDEKHDVTIEITTTDGGG